MQAVAAAQQPSPAQTSSVTAEQQDDATVQQMREEHRSQRRKIVAANLPLTETEATKFWPLYDRYRNEMGTKIYDVRYALIKEYAQNYANMTEDQADTFITRWLSLDSDNAQIEERYVPEFEKVISRKKTAMFFQVDHRVTMMFDLKLVELIPLVNP
jgi:Spy/CpxP family protein refolding chaperone